MTVDPAVSSAMKAFDSIFARQLPQLANGPTAFLAFMCALGAIDSLAAYRTPLPPPATREDVGRRYKLFIKDFFPASYLPHLDKLYLLRCRMLHNFSPAHFTLSHGAPERHLRPSQINDVELNAESFVQDVLLAARAFFDEVAADQSMQQVMRARLDSVERGGSIGIV